MDKTKVSIDLWGTLIKASPSFKQNKLPFIQKLYKDIHHNEIVNAFIKTKMHFDFIIERSGYQPSKYELWRVLLSHFSNRFPSDEEIDILSANYNKLAIDNPPAVYSKETIPYLKMLGHTYDLVLSSNTLFLTGETLTTILSESILDIIEYFDTVNFSDVLHCAKPHFRMYGGSQYHIGDNLRTDYWGPRQYSIDAFRINSNSKTIKHAYEYIARQEKFKNGTTKVCSA